MRALPLTLLFAAACGGNVLVGNGKVAESTRDVGSFDALAVTSGLAVDVTVGGNPQILIRGDENIVRAVSTTREGSTAAISLPAELTGIQPKVALSIVVQVPTLAGLTVSAKSNVSAGRLLASGFDLQISGESRVTLEGDAKDLRLTMSEKSVLNGAGLVAETLAIDGSGGSRAELRVTRRMSGKLSGDSKLILIGGNPPEKTVTVEDSSVIEMRER